MEQRAHNGPTGRDRIELAGLVAGLTLVSAGASMYLGGCSSWFGPKKQTESRAVEGQVNTGLDSLAMVEEDEFTPRIRNREATATPSDSDIAVAAQAGLDLQAMLKDKALREAPLSPRGEKREATDGESPAAEEPPEDPSSPPPAIEEITPPSQPSADERLQAHLSSLITLLRVRAATANEPFNDYLALVALEALRADVISLDEREVEGVLLPDEIEALRAVQGVVRELAESGDPTRASEIIETARRDLAQGQPLSIPTLALCSRVNGFGKFEELPSTTLVAGSAHRMIVYVEVDHMTHREASQDEGGASDRWAVELTQELELRHDPDGMLAWRRPTMRTIDTSRNQRRDFYVVSEIELPETLTIGSYALKVRMTDQTSGDVAEAVVPIRVVAHQLAVK